MSLILDALRKSEAERRRTQVPDLLAQPQAASRPTRSTPLRWPLLLLGGGLLLGTMWMLRGAWTQPSSTRPEAAHVATGTDAGSVAPVVRAPPRVPSSPPEAAVAPTQRPLILAPPAATARLPSAPVATVPVAPAVSATPQPSTSSATAAVETSPAITVPSSPPADTPLRLADLGSDERKQLPPLKLSMHMWNDVPSQRFVIIDGTRLTIGERIGDAAIADIVSDGVVLDWNGRLLKLSLR